MSTNNQDNIQLAADSIFNHISMRQHHINMQRTVPNLDLINILTEDYLAGYMQDGRMSVVRRFFCLFVLFDVFFISLLWLICIMLNGETIYDAFSQEIMRYTISTSLFDIVAIAFLRGIFLIFFYAILYTNHWLVIFLTTTGSCTFVIVKVFHYNWPNSPQPVFQVLLIIISCVLAWGEAWFLDCRVIPKEKHAQRLFRIIMSERDERSPLINPYASNYASSQVGGESSIANFYSPVESQNNSDEEVEEEVHKYRTIADQNLLKAYDLLKCTEWKLEKTTSTGDTIYSIQRDPIGKIYRLKATIDISAKKLFEKSVAGINEMSQWNPTVIESRKLCTIDSHTDITYQVSAPAAGGLIKSRDFVNLRSCHMMKNGEILQKNDIYKSKSNASILSFKTLQERQPLKRTNQKPKKENDEVATLNISMGGKTFSSDFVDKSSSDEDTDEVCNDPVGLNGQLPSYQIDDGEELSYVISATGIEYNKMPPVPQYIRGNNVVACWVFRESPEDQDKCLFEWIFCLDLKGYFPRYILDKAYATVMQESMIYLRQLCNGLSNDDKEKTVCVAEVHNITGDSGTTN